ncbi:cytochrome c-type biogenesis protein CcmH [Mergibacter septicus]|uniref:Cytochrome c-type biogenesis protein n=1 Tax=Mergibacter septicus TaxID=221402 RepID=A0A8E3MHC0_9PAST|nr:cytochrome c-type biogenesis protein CcmH [Mergibacter septicus]AWX16284.1 cytochrome c-type biogenesis protein CcmH [Mergibacter septicus]QDJ13865.1 cytochrome c-type biogenesis protein CcmH [Mergibacter septicus]QDJ15535.1 cytochrome c-type biogenesis protein CcmH [Mergibacter septicus]UTU48894.1 cytochrome c-type biogenesis protein CcmH [Mergibacter septicus]WMR96804.1 cytochrome c-type biogenesis protein CcmH [Mergibacter septicus]
MQRFLFLFCLSLGSSGVALASIDALQFSSPQQEREYHELTQQLRCPQCQNNSIADSNAIIATDMRAKVFELLQQGSSKQQVIDYMVARYGHFVTYDPPLNGSTVILWLAPALLLLLGTFWLLFYRRKESQDVNLTTSSKSELTQQEQQRLEQLLKENKE